MVYLKRFLSITFIGLIFLTAGFFARWYYVSAGNGGTTPPTSYNRQATSNSYDVLIMGMDARPGQLVGNTDVMMLVHVDQQKNQVSIMSVPRDTRVQVSGYGPAKINAALMIGGEKNGPALALQTVNHLLGSDAHYYVITTFTGFQRIVDALGGVDFNVPQNMYYMNDPTARINLHKGYQHLNGQQALEFVRFRDFALGDIGRTMDQQTFLKAIIKQHLNFGGVLRLPQLLPVLHQAITTNMPGSLVYDLAHRFMGSGQNRAFTETLPGAFWTLDGISYWHVIPADARWYYQQLLKGKVYPYMDPKAAITSAPAPAIASTLPPVGSRVGSVQQSVQADSYRQPPVPASIYGGGMVANPPAVIVPPPLGDRAPSSTPSGTP